MDLKSPDLRLEHRKQMLKAINTCAMFCFSLIFTLEVLGETAVVNKYQARNLLRYFLHCNIYTCDTLNTGLLTFKLINSSHTFAENTS